MALANIDERGYSWKVPWQQQSMGTHELNVNQENDIRMDNNFNRSSNFLQNNKDLGDLKWRYDVTKPLTFDRFPLNIDNCPLPDSTPIIPFQTITDLSGDYKNTPSAHHNIGTSFPTLSKFLSFNRTPNDVKTSTLDNYNTRGPPKLDWDPPRLDTSFNWKRVPRTNTNTSHNVYNSFLSPENRDYMGRRDCKGIGRPLVDKLYVDDSLNDFVRNIKQNACLPGPRQPVKWENQRKNIYNDKVDYAVSRVPARHVPINPLSDNYLDRLDAYLEKAAKVPTKSNTRRRNMPDQKTEETQTTGPRGRSSSLGAEKNTQKPMRLKPRSVSTPRLKRRDSCDRLKQMPASTGFAVDGTKVNDRNPPLKNRNMGSDKCIRFKENAEASTSSTVFGTRCSLSRGQKKALRGVIDDMTSEEGKFLMGTVLSIMNSRIENKNIVLTKKTKALAGSKCQRKKATVRHKREMSSDDRRCEEYIQTYCGSCSSTFTSDSGSCSPARGVKFNKAFARQTPTLPSESKWEKSCYNCCFSDDNHSEEGEKKIKTNGIKQKDRVCKCADKCGKQISRCRNSVYIRSTPATAKTRHSYCQACRKMIARPNVRDITPTKYQGKRAYSLKRGNTNSKNQAKIYTEKVGDYVTKKRGRSREKTAKRTNNKHETLSLLKDKDERDKRYTSVNNSSNNENDLSEIDNVRTPTPSPPVEKSIVETNKKIVPPQDRIQILSLNQSFGSLRNHRQHNMQYSDQFIKSTHDESIDVQPDETIETSLNQSQKNSPSNQSLKAPVSLGQKDNSNVSCSSNSTTVVAAEGQDPKVDLDTLSFDVISRLSDVSLSQQFVELNLSKDHDPGSVGLIKEINNMEPILDGDKEKDRTLQIDSSECDETLKQKIMLNLNRKTQTLLKKASNQILNVERFLESIASDKSTTILVKEDDTTTFQNEDKSNNILNSNVAQMGLSKDASQSSNSSVKAPMNSQAGITTNSKTTLKMPPEDAEIPTVHNESDQNKSNSSIKYNLCASRLCSYPPYNSTPTKKKSSTPDVLNSTIEFVASEKKQLSFLYNQQSVIEAGSSTASICTSSKDSTIVSLNTSESVSCLDERNFDDTFTHEHDHCRHCVSTFYETKSAFAQQSNKNKSQSQGEKERKCGRSKTSKPVLVKVYDASGDIPVKTSFCTFESESGSNNDVDGFWWENAPSCHMHQISQTKIVSKGEESSDRKHSKSLCCTQTFINTKQHAPTNQSQTEETTKKFAKDVVPSVNRPTISSDSKKVDRHRPRMDAHIFRKLTIRKSSKKPPFRV